METRKILAILVLGLMVCQAKVSEAGPMGTAFTYQGHLYDANHAADGLYDFQFNLYDANSGGSRIGSDVNVADVDVIDGYFTVQLDFNDPNAFNGDARWLEIGVRPGDQNDPNTYTPLVPRQEITPAPYARYAASAPGGGGVSVPLELSGAVASPGAVIKGTNSGSGYGVRGEHDSSGNYGYLGSSDFGVYGYSGSYGVYGYNSSSNYGYLGGNSYGVRGYSSSGSGVYGSSSSSYGVYGKHSSSDNSGYLGGNSYGAYGKHNSTGNYGYLGSASYGVYGSGTYGVYGSASDTGVYGENSSSGNYGFLGSSAYGVYGSASDVGVYGENSSSGNYGYLGGADGVLGFSISDYGVFGYSNNSDGVHGYNGSSGNYGYLGSSDYGVYGRDDSSGNYGYLGSNNYGVRGYNSGSGNYGYLGSASYGVHGRSDSGRGVYGYSDSGKGVYGASNIGHAGYFTGKGYFSGSVGIGTESPDEKLHILNTSGNAKAKVESDSGYARLIMDGTSGNLEITFRQSGSYLGAVGYDPTNDHLYIFNGGNVVVKDGDLGVGTTSPGYDLHVIGDIAYTGNIYDISDVRLKENITPLRNGIEKISCLQGIYFNNKGESSDNREVGVIAQDVEKVLPELVSTDKQGYKSVDYTKLTPVLIEAVKELKAENESLKQRLEAQEKMLQQLQTAITKGVLQ